MIPIKLGSTMPYIQQNNQGSPGLPFACPGSAYHHDLPTAKPFGHNPLPKRSEKMATCDRIRCDHKNKHPKNNSNDIH